MLQTGLGSLASVVAPHLYLDPGSGSILIQVLIAALLGIGIIVRTQWARIKKWFGRKPANNSENPSGDQDEQ